MTERYPPFIGSGGCVPRIDFLHVCPNVIVGEVNLPATIEAVPTGSREAEIGGVS